MNQDVIQKTIRFVRDNIDQDLSLEKLAKHVFLSPFHFQRVFREATKETPKQYITRVRLELAAHNIVLCPGETILSQALNCGYNSHEAFTRAFKRRYSISPDAFRRKSESEKMQLIRETSHQDNPQFDFDSVVGGLESTTQSIDFEITIERIPARKLIYIPTTLASTTQVLETLRSIKTWANARELGNHIGGEHFGLFVDYPLFTALDKCRYLACVSVDRIPKLSGSVQSMEMPAHTYASYEVEGSISDLLKKTNIFWKQWLPAQGYRIAHIPARHTLLEPLSDKTFEAHRFQLSIGIEPE